MFVPKFNAFKRMFFDRTIVLDAVEAARRKTLSRGAAFIWKRAKSSIRSRKKSSLPGRPPHSHTGILKRFLFFGYDDRTQTAVIGPAKVNQVSFTATRRVARSGPPEILEEGGSYQVLEVQYPSGKWYRADLRSRRRIAEMPQRWRTVTIEARPYMGPAKKAEEPKLAALWADSVKAA